MKAGIITFSSAHNYGAVLQVYAMQEYLKGIGTDVDIINYRPNAIDRVYKLYNIKKSNSNIIKIYRKSKKILKVNLMERWKLEKNANFESFINNVLNTTKPYYSLSEIQKDFLEYDILIAGSDQIWNVELTKRFDPAYFLEFGNKEAKRISYAASIGMNELPEKYCLFYKRYLKNFDFISVREESMRNLLRPLTNRAIETVVDPTLLLDKEQYDKLKINTHLKGQDYIYVHFIGKDDKTYEVADQMSRLLNLPIVHNREKGLFENELESHYHERPEQFISVIENAKYVISNSFHTTVFAIIYGKNFITIPHKKRPERMKNLLHIAGLDNHLIEDVRLLPTLETLDIDYKSVKENLLKEREKSIEFLNNSINNEKPDKKLDNYFNTKDKFNCYSCELCKNICPVEAITMEEDIEGFRYPVIDEGKCIKCGLCKNKCIYHNGLENKDEIPSIVMAAYNKNKNVLKSSSSGGVFTALYEYVIKQKGYVVGVKYNEKMEAVYAMASSLKECEKFRGSKYVEAKVQNIKKEIKDKLEDGKIVLFVGNPCQLQALRSFLGKPYENLYLVEIICHSIPSAKVFKNYIHYLENKYESKVIDFKFRDKAKGWGNGKATIKVTFENGKEIEELAKYNNYNRAFASNYIQRLSCYNCEFAGDNKFADMTIGDYWGIEKVMPKVAKREKNGISIIKINSNKGKKLFDKIKPDLEYFESDYKNGYRQNHKTPVLLNKKKINFTDQLDTLEINQLLKKFNKFKNKKTSNKKVVKKSL